MNIDKFIIAAVDGEVGYEVLNFLLLNDYPVIGILSESNECIKLAKKDIKVFANANNLEIYLKENSSQQKDFFFVHAWTKIFFPKSLLNYFAYTLNIHPGVVPEVRGNCTATWAIRRQLPTGVSLLEINYEMDAGKVYAINKIDCNKFLSGKLLQKKLKFECVKFFKEKFEDIFIGKIRSYDQVGDINSFTKKMTQQDRILSSKVVMPLGEVVLWALAHDFTNESYPIIQFDKKYFKITVQEVSNGSDIN